MSGRTSPRGPWFTIGVWVVGFLAFPVAGLAGEAVVGRADDPLAAALGGAVAGLVVGIGQSLASLRRLDPRRWVPASVLGMAVGLLAGAALVGYGTTLGELALMGAVAGLVLGVAQTFALPRRARLPWMWAAAITVLWALGWTVTSAFGVDVEQQYVIFGSSGAIVFSVLSGLVLQRLVPTDAAGGR